MADIAVENIRELWAALHHIRGELEEHAIVQPEIPEPDPGREAEFLVQAIADLVAYYENRIQELECDLEGAGWRAHQAETDASRRIQQASESARQEREAHALRESDMRRKAQKLEEDRNWNRLLGRY